MAEDIGTRLTKDLGIYAKTTRERMTRDLASYAQASFTKVLHTDQQIKDYFSKLNPQEAQSHWADLDEEQRQRLTGIMGTHS